MWILRLFTSWILIIIVGSIVLGIGVFVIPLVGCLCLGMLVSSELFRWKTGWASAFKQKTEAKDASHPRHKFRCHESIIKIDGSYINSHELPDLYVESWKKKSVGGYWYKYLTFRSHTLFKVGQIIEVVERSHLDSYLNALAKTPAVVERSNRVEEEVISWH
jgi:hypothetical protein